MKAIKLLTLIVLCNITTVTAYAQTVCEDKLLDYVASLDADSLNASLNLILSIKAYEDIPYYDEFRFTSSPYDPQYFLLKKSNPEAPLDYKVFDWDNNEIETKEIKLEGKGESLFTLQKHQSGNYRLVLYSKNPDGSCFSLSKLKRKKKRIQIPSSKLDQNADLEDLTLLKEYIVNVNTEDLPALKEYSYVFTKGTDYYFYWESNENLKLKVTNSKREEQTLNSLGRDNELMKLNCEATGIYYIIIYAKEAVRQNSTLKFYFDEESRKSN